TQAGGNRGAGVACPETVIPALGALGKATYSAVLTQGAKFLLAPGQELVCISLMADIPDETVMCGIEYVMKSYCQFHYTETGSKVPAVFGDSAYDSSANFLSQIEKLWIRKAFYLMGHFDTGKVLFTHR